MQKILISACLLGAKVRYNAIDGQSITAALLTQHGIQVFNEEQIQELAEALVDD